MFVKAVAVVSLPVRELAEWRRVQEMARRRAQTAAWGRRYPSAVMLARPGSRSSTVFPGGAR